MAEANMKKEKVEKINPEDVEIVEAIAHGKVKKESMSQKIANTFISDEADTVGDFILYDVIIPSIKDAMGDILHGTIDRVFGGTGYRGRSRRRSRDYDDYSDYYYNGGRRRRRRSSIFDDDDDDDYYGERRRRRRNRRSDNFHRVGDMSRDEVGRVLEKMSDYMQDYGNVPVAKVKYWTGLDDEVISTDNDWGWFDMRDVRRFHDKDGYGLEFQPPEPLD